MLLSHSGWRFERLLRCCVQRINDVWNAPTAAGPTPDLAPDFERFVEVATLFDEMSQADALDLRYRRLGAEETLDTVPLGDPGTPFVMTLVFGDAPEVAQQSKRLKEILVLRSDLNTKSTFNLLDQLFQLQSGTIRRAGPVLTLPLN